uniref:Uncharacterized protein n=1 Tax=Parascaris equorum TaxID=6256 RepID=A0A914R1L6_PAREQ
MSISSLLGINRRRLLGHQHWNDRWRCPNRERSRY